MEIITSSENSIKSLELTDGKVEILDGGPKNIFLRVESDKEHIGNVLEELVTIVLAQDAKIRDFDSKNTNDYINFNKTFVKENVDKILESQGTFGDHVRLSGKLEGDGSYSVVLITNNEDRALKMADESLSFKEWFLNAARNYKPITIEQ